MISSHKKLLVNCLLLFSTTLVLATGAGDTMHLIGTWELVGLGDATGNITRPQKVVMSFFASGKCQLRVWERGESQPDEAICRFAVSEDVLELTFGAPETTESLRITRDGWQLVLDPIDASARHPVALRFEKRAWILP